MREKYNLIGMYAIVFLEEQYKGKTYTVFITGQATDDTFIVQVVSPLTGQPNVARLVNIKDMKDWLILPTREIADEVLEDWRKSDCKNFRYQFELSLPENKSDK